MVPKKIMSPEGGVSCRQMAGRWGGWQRRWADSVAQARKQCAQRQEVREKECAGQERSVKARGIDRG